MSKVKKYELNPDKTGIIYHTTTKDVTNIDDYDQYVNDRINEKIFHYLIIEDLDGNFKIVKSKDLNEDTDFFFPNFENIKCVKNYCQTNYLPYNCENHKKYTQMIHDLIPLYNLKAFDLIDYNDYNHFFLHVNIIGNFLNPTKETYKKIGRALFDIMRTYNMIYFEEYKYKYSIGFNNFDYKTFNEIVVAKLLGYSIK